MRRAMLIAAALVVGLASIAVAQTAPKLESAKLETRAVTGSLDAAFRTIVSAQMTPAWIGYSVAQIPGERSMCGTVSLEGAREFVMLYRVVGGQVEKIRTYPTDCTFDAGDLPFFWLTGVDGTQSASMLASFIPPAADTKESRQLSSSAFSAIARHGEGAPALIDLARKTSVSQETRRQAVMWLGRSRDPRALKFFEEILASR